MWSVGIILGRTTKVIIPFCPKIEDIQLLITGHNDLHLCHILDVDASHRHQ